VDYKQMGVGGDNSWGARTHDEYRLTEKEYQYSFRMKAISSGESPLNWQNRNCKNIFTMLKRRKNGKITNGRFCAFVLKIYF
jgi:hypothetical protein